MKKTKYDYRAAMYDDIKNYITENIDFADYEDREDLEQKLYNDLWCEDAVTGNGSGSYFFNTYKAEEAICHNLDLLGEAVEEFGGDMDVLKSGAEACDVTIRCYLLGEIIHTVLDELLDNESDK